MPQLQSLVEMLAKSVDGFFNTEIAGVNAGEAITVGLSTLLQMIRVTYQAIVTLGDVLGAIIGIGVNMAINLMSTFRDLGNGITTVA